MEVQSTILLRSTHARVIADTGVVMGSSGLISPMKRVLGTFVELAMYGGDSLRLITIDGFSALFNADTLLPR